MNEIVSTATTNLNGIVSDAETYVDEAKTSCANDKSACQTLKYDVEEIADNIGNPVTGISFSDGNLVITKATGEPVSIKISNPLDAYPVGSFYFSANATSPATLFGGTWEQLEQGRVLLSQGTNYPAGSTGGEATHTLTVAEMPSHNHAPNKTYSSGDRACFTINKDTVSDATARTRVASTSSGNLYAMTTNTSASDSDGIEDITQEYQTGNTGSSNAHNNLQPYLSVYIWKRTA